MKKKIFSGVQPTGNLHLGNYLGAIKNFVALQKKMECIYCVVDLHAITVFQEPKDLRKNILETTAGFVACGLDFKKSIIFNQKKFSSHVLSVKMKKNAPIQCKLKKALTKKERTLN